MMATTSVCPTLRRATIFPRTLCSGLTWLGPLSFPIVLLQLPVRPERTRNSLVATSVSRVISGLKRFRYYVSVALMTTVVKVRGRAPGCKSLSYVRAWSTRRLATTCVNKNGVP